MEWWAVPLLIGLAWFLVRLDQGSNRITRSIQAVEGKNAALQDDLDRAFRRISDLEHAIDRLKRPAYFDALDRGDTDLARRLDDD